MVRPKRLRARGIFSRLATPQKLPGVLTTSEFETAFVRERARVDRYSGHFALVVLTPRESGPNTVPSIAAGLIDRIREPDLIGRLDHEKLALLLPETGPEGAWRLTEDLLERISEAGESADCVIYVYPFDDGLGNGTQSKNGSEKRNGDDSSDGEGSAPHHEQKEPVALDDWPVHSELTLSEARGPEHRWPVMDLGQYLNEPLPFWKRLLDVVVSTALLVVLSPLFLTTALAIKLTSRGPVFFRQKRAGLGGLPFDFYKFRSMRVGAEDLKEDLLGQNEKDGPIFKIRDDPRLTPIGRLLRKTSIDELPQLWNVLRGDMTLVGPRPPTLDEVPSYELWQRRRLNLTGGLTCIWQVSGRSEVGFEDWMRMDVRYAKRRSFLGDMKLLSRTLRAVFTGRGAY